MGQIQNRDIQKEIGQRLKVLRQYGELNQLDVARVLGVTASAYGKLEYGERGLSSRNCIALSELYGVTCDYILKGEHPAAQIVNFSKECELIGGNLLEASRALERIGVELIKR